MIIEQILENKTNYKKRKYSENPLRSVIKSISWRAVGTVDTVVISWVVTRQINTALSIGIIELATKMVLYFFHERVWNTIKWGKNEGIKY